MRVLLPLSLRPFALFLTAAIEEGGGGERGGARQWPQPPTILLGVLWAHASHQEEDLDL